MREPRRTYKNVRFDDSVNYETRYPEDTPTRARHPTYTSVDWTWYSSLVPNTRVPGTPGRSYTRLSVDVEMREPRRTYKNVRFDDSVNYETRYHVHQCRLDLVL
jgi:hypothetical protein